MLYQTILFIGALLSAVHAASYAYRLWKKGLRISSLAIGCACIGTLVLAGRLVMLA